MPSTKISFNLYMLLWVSRWCWRREIVIKSISFRIQQVLTSRDSRIFNVLVVVLLAVVASFLLPEIFASEYLQVIYFAFITAWFEFTFVYTPLSGGKLLLELIRRWILLEPISAIVLLPEALMTLLGNSARQENSCLLMSEKVCLLIFAIRWEV